MALMNTNATFLSNPSSQIDCMLRELLIMAQWDVFQESKVVLTDLSQGSALYAQRDERKA
jgi:hypothetical protein